MPGHQYQCSKRKDCHSFPVTCSRCRVRRRGNVGGMVGSFTQAHWQSSASQSAISAVCRQNGQNTSTISLLKITAKLVDQAGSALLRDVLKCQEQDVNEISSTDLILSALIPSNPDLILSNPFGNLSDQKVLSYPHRVFHSAGQQNAGT